MTIPARSQATWLEVVRAAKDENRRVEIHPIPAAEGAPMAVSVASRLLCSNNGRITVFEDLTAAVRFLSIAGVRTWNIGDALNGIANLLPGAEQLRMRGGRLCG